TLMVALFKTEQKLLTWVSTTPFDLAPWPGRAAFDRAMAARLAEDYASADNYLSAAIQASPDNANYYYWRGDTRIYLRKYDAALELSQCGVPRRNVDCATLSHVLHPRPPPGYVRSGGWRRRATR